ncbi:MAG: AraC family transcriptional regulator [Collimonas sp.]|uniref:AraC family transcriptional regulator n=1 Tax=Collimonas sp. TaxID=1963772 RepID=UPI003263E9F4
MRRLLSVFIDELVNAAPEPLSLTMPRDPRLLKMAAAIAENPADDTSLDAWADQIGMSRRSITRHFRSETGMSVVEWRQIARLQHGLELLAKGTSVTAVAITLGYDSVSSFIALFRRALGTTPAKMAERGA